MTTELRPIMTSLAAAVLLGLAASGTPALADGKKDCTTAPQASWRPEADAETAAKAAGYEVRRTKVEGTCFEVYAVKDGKRFELFYEPIELKLVHIVEK